MKQDIRTDTELREVLAELIHERWRDCIRGITTKMHFDQRTGMLAILPDDYRPLISLAKIEYRDLPDDGKDACLSKSNEILSLIEDWTRDRGELEY